VHRPTSAIVFFKGSLPDDASDEELLQALNRGTQRVAQTFTHLRELNRNELFCAATYEGQPSEIAELKQFVEDEKLGHTEMDAFKPAFIASPIIPASVL
jgi:hypothetical protein